MSTKIIVSYDGTANEDDALALGRVFAKAGAEVALAYVRHSQEPDLDREKLAQSEAEELLQRGAALFGNADVARHVVTDRSTPEGLRALAEREGASVVVFCSDSHTASGHVAVGNSAQQLLEGGPVAVAIAPVGLADSTPEIGSIVAIGDADGGARATAESLAAALGATVAPVANDEAGLLVARLAPRGRAGSRLDQRLGGAPRRHRHLLGAGAAARQRSAVRSGAHGGAQRLARIAADGPSPASAPAAARPHPASMRSPRSAIGRERLQQVQRAAHEVAQRPRPQPRLHAPVCGNAVAGLHDRARYRGVGERRA